jgi:hypothetical protein
VTVSPFAITLANPKSASLTWPAALSRTVEIGKTGLSCIVQSSKAEDRCRKGKTERQTPLTVLRLQVNVTGYAASLCMSDDSNATPGASDKRWTGYDGEVSVFYEVD